MKWNVNKASAYAIIGARSGSKTIPQKNIARIGPFPLIAYSIAAGLLTKGIERVIVSTDSDVIATLAIQYGAEAPFLRPAELAGDEATDRGFLVHALEWLQEREGSIPEFIVLLRPTSPLRDPKYIAEALELMKQSPDATGLRSAHITDIVPQKMLRKEGKYFKSLLPGLEHAEDHTLPRQVFPPAYKADGYVDVLRSSYILSHPHRTYGDCILAFMTPNTGDIDSQTDLHFVRSSVASGQWEIEMHLRKHHA